MSKIVTAKDILREKGYIQNKFDTNGFTNVVAGMFKELPVNGCITLIGIRFVDTILPMDIRDDKKGFYYLTPEYKKIQEKYLVLNEDYLKLKRELDTAEQLYDKLSDELFDKVWKQVEWYRVRAIRNWRSSTNFKNNMSDKEILEQSIKSLEEGESYPKEFEKTITILTKRIQSRVNMYSYFPKVKLTPLFIYIIIKTKLQNGEKLLFKLENRYNKYDELFDKENSSEFDLEDYIAENKEILGIQPNTIYIDEPFLKNAAETLSVLCGYVVEKQSKNKVSSYRIRLI